MSAVLISIQLGKLRSEGENRWTDPADKPWTTGFYKLPVTGPVRVSGDGLVGDQIADTKHHGGEDKAVLAYAARHYDDWRSELLSLGVPAPLAAEFHPGALGENLTIQGLSEDNVCLGDTWQVGTQLQLQVSQPRQPCWKINRRWRAKRMTQRVAQTGRTGWYCRVLAPGEITAGDSVVLLHRPHRTWTVARANDVLMGRELDQYAAMELLAIPELAAAWKQALS